MMMGSKLRLSVCVMIVAAGTVMGRGTPPNQQAEQRVPARRAGTVLYELKADATPEQKQALAQVFQETGLQSNKKLRQGAVRAHTARGAAESEEDLALRVMQSGAVEWAEPDYEVEAVLIPNDPLFVQQWWHKNISTPAAWDVTTGRTNIIVAVCDTGVQTTHPDLAAELILPGYNTFLNNTYIEDTVGHGTMVAGFVGAIGNNSLGVAGVAWNIRILPIRITYADGVGSAYVSDMAEGLSYGADHGARVINCSFSGYNSSTVESAAKYARGKGAVVCFAAGNSGLDLTSYLDSVNIVVVGATTASDVLAYWSNFGKPIDVVAPGENVLSTYLGSGYAVGSGTSFASPITAGLVALIFAVNPGLSPLEAELILKTTCEDLGVIGDDNIYGAGLVQADVAVALAARVIAIPTALKAKVLLKTVTLTWSDNANNETGYYVERAPVTRKLVGTYTRVATLSANAISFSQIVTAGTYSFRVKAFNGTTLVSSEYSAPVSVIVK